MYTRYSLSVHYRPALLAVTVVTAEPTGIFRQEKCRYITENATHHDAWADTPVPHCVETTCSKFYVTLTGRQVLLHILTQQSIHLWGDSTVMSGKKHPKLISL